MRVNRIKYKDIESLKVAAYIISRGGVDREQFNRLASAVGWSWATSRRWIKTLQDIGFEIGWQTVETQYPSKVQREERLVITRTPAWFKHLAFDES